MPRAWSPHRAALATATAMTLLLGAAASAAADGSPAEAPVPDLGFGAQGPAVTELQSDLLALGFVITGTANGTFGATTWEGLVFFQRDAGLYPGGTTTPATWQALRAALGAEPFGSVPLAEWDTGASVVTLQGDLHQAGYTPGPADGNFGPQTQSALAAFQAAHGLPAAGVFDAATRDALLAAVGISGYAPAPVPVPDLADGLASAGSQGRAAGPAARTTSSPAADGSAGVPAAPASGPAILAYWSVYGSNTTALTSLETNAGHIRWLSPFWYTMRSTGTLVSHETDHAQVLAAAAAGGVRVLPLINDGAGLDALLSTAAGRQTAVQAVGALLAANPAFAGVMIDFESMPASAGSDLTAFVSALRADLPAADTVGVAVGPEVSANQPGEGLFQYAALGRVANLVQIMTYDDHDNGSAPGPVSPTPWVQRVADFAASVIPASKILLGVPAYGYDWSAPGAGQTVTIPQALALAAAHGVTPTLNAADGEETFQYTAASGDVHTVWFEDPAGVAAKRQIAVQLGLGGLAMWTIGGESPAFWPALEGS